MSERYELTGAATAPVRVVGPGTVLGEDTVAHHGLVIGDPHAGAMVVEGTRAELVEFVSLLGASLSLTAAGDGLPAGNGAAS